METLIHVSKQLPGDPFSPANEYDWVIVATLYNKEKPAWTIGRYSKLVGWEIFKEYDNKAGCADGVLDKKDSCVFGRCDVEYWFNVDLIGENIEQTAELISRGKKMESIKKLLGAVIKYQDVMDQGLNEPGVGELYIDMLDQVDITKKQHPALIGQFNFRYCADRMQEFDNLQAFITVAERII